MRKEYIKRKVYEMLREVESPNYFGPINENETIGEIFGLTPERGNEFLVSLKIVELTVGLENNLRIAIEKDYRNILRMRLKDFVDYVFYLA
ncbi:MAG: hypothetical protein J6Y53_01820 [Alphaproteobacteria bacterium]|nr:hypothetical protein [Alphaproteobacteria bacterium]